MSGAQTWVLKNEVLEKSNTQFSAPPIKIDLSSFVGWRSEAPDALLEEKPTIILIIKIPDFA